MAYATTNPYTGETLATFPDATDAEVGAALDVAQATFLNWREQPIAARLAVLQKAADLLRADAQGYARLLTLEMGKLFSEAQAEVELSAAIFEYYVENAEALLAPEALPSKDPAVLEAQLVHEPLGIILAMSRGTSPTTRSPGSSPRSWRWVTWWYSSMPPTCRNAPRCSSG